MEQLPKILAHLNAKACADILKLPESRAPSQTELFDTR